jgi:hypothetical protein
MSENKHWQPIPHWNNYTIPELKEILMHLQALEQLGIAQDPETIKSIQRDIDLRSKKPKPQMKTAEKPIEALC